MKIFISALIGVLLGWGLVFVVNAAPMPAPPDQTPGISISVPTYGVVVRADGCTVNPCQEVSN